MIGLARAELEGGGTEAEVRTLLDRLGDPADIAADAAEGSVAAPAPPRPGWVEGLALVLLPVDGLILPFAGWLVGVVLLWSSHVWRTRDKLLGTRRCLRSRAVRVTFIQRAAARRAR
jgi:hypothetical protein